MPVRSVETLFLVSVHQLTDNSTLGKKNSTLFSCIYLLAPDQSKLKPFLFIESMSLLLSDDTSLFASMLLARAR